MSSERLPNSILHCRAIRLFRFFACFILLQWFGIRTFCWLSGSRLVWYMTLRAGYQIVVVICLTIHCNVLVINGLSFAADCRFHDTQNFSYPYTWFAPLYIPPHRKYTWIFWFYLYFSDIGRWNCPFEEVLANVQSVLFFYFYILDPFDFLFALLVTQYFWYLMETNTNLYLFMYYQ